MTGDLSCAGPAVDYSHILLSYVVPLYFNQAHSSFLSELLGRYAGYSPAVLDRVQFVLVDDASPVPLSLPADLDLNLLVLRVRDDKPWNQGGARNLGVVYARSDKVFLADVDHALPEAALAHLVQRRNPGRRVYKLARVTPDGQRKRAAPNILFLSRGRFLRFFGYDEEFCGAYGFEDLWFLRWQRYHGSRIVRLPRRYAAELRDVDRDGAYHSLQRDVERNRELYQRKRRACESFGPESGHSRQFLRFQWDVALDRRRRAAPPEPTSSALWQVAWRWSKITGGRY